MWRRLGFFSSALRFLRGVQNVELFCNFYWLVPCGNAAGLIPDLSAPRPRLWLVRDANAVFITHCLRALPCLTLKIYSGIRESCGCCHINSPTHVPATTALRKNLLLKRASALYFLAFYHGCSTRAWHRPLDLCCKDRFNHNSIEEKAWHERQPDQGQTRSVRRPSGSGLWRLCGPLYALTAS